MNRTVRWILGLAVLGWVTVGCSDNSNPFEIGDIETSGGLAAASHTVTTDFEPFVAGTVITNQIAGLLVSVQDEGASCTTDALIFDSANPVGTAIDDFDLGTPNEACAGPGIGAGNCATNDTPLGNLLIIQESEPNPDTNDSWDDCAGGGTLRFDFASLVRMESVTLVDHGDTEGDAKIRLFDSGDVQIGADHNVPGVLNNGVTVFGLPGGGVDDVARLDVVLAGSGATDNLIYSPNDEGCTPGKWKNWTGLKRQANIWPPTGFSQGQALSSVFTGVDGSLASTSLLAALSFSGGPGVIGKQKILLRAAVAALLNASHPGVAYPLSQAEVIAMVNAALAGPEAGLITLATELDDFNNLGCPSGDLT